MSVLLDNKKIELDYMSDISSNKLYNIKEMMLTKLSKTALLEKCEELGITKCKGKNRCELILLINSKSVKTHKPKPQTQFIIEDDIEEKEVEEEEINEMLDEIFDIVDE